MREHVRDDRPANPVRRRAAPCASACGAGSTPRPGLRPVAEGHAVLLDGKPVRTPARPCAWRRRAGAGGGDRGRMGRPARHDRAGKMPLTRLANSIIDGVADQPGRSPRRSPNILASDCCSTGRRVRPRTRRAAARSIGTRSSAGRRKRSARILSARRGRDLHRSAAGGGRRRARRDPAKIPGVSGAAHVATTLTGSALIALALATASCPPMPRGRPPMSTRTGTWSSGAATSWRSNAATIASPSCRRRRRCWRHYPVDAGFCLVTAFARFLAISARQF